MSIIYLWTSPITTDEGGLAKVAKVLLLRHRQTKEAETDRPGLKLPEPALYSTLLLNFDIFLPTASLNVTTA